MKKNTYLKTVYLRVGKNICPSLMPSRVAMLLFVCVTCFSFLHAVGLAAQSRPAEGSLLDTGPELAAEFLVQYREKAMKRWSQDIETLEQRDVVQRDPEDAILFIGSSSIRRWDTIEIDMRPYQVVQRGYGGAKYTDLAVFAKRLIHPHEYSALVVFVANDVQGKPEDHSPEQVEKCASYIAGVSRKHCPQAPIFFIEITPTRKLVFKSCLCQHPPPTLFRQQIISWTLLGIHGMNCLLMTSFISTVMGIKNGQY